MRGSRPGTEVRAWRPAVAGITEVLHAHFTDHAYPVHTHDTWDLMLLDDGAVDFALDRRRHGAWDASRVVLLPPGVPHDGRTVDPTGFRKRVLYLDTDVLPERLAGHAVDVPVLGDPLLRRRVHRLHAALRDDTEVFEAQSRLAFVRERLLYHLGATAPAGGGGGARPPPPDHRPRGRPAGDAAARAAGRPAGHRAHPERGDRAAARPPDPPDPLLHPRIRTAAAHVPHRQAHRPGPPAAAGRAAAGAGGHGGRLLRPGAPEPALHPPYGRLAGALRPRAAPRLTTAAPPRRIRPAWRSGFSRWRSPGR